MALPGLLPYSSRPTKKPTVKSATAISSRIAPSAAPTAAPLPGKRPTVMTHVAPSNTSQAAGAAGSAYSWDGTIKPGREGEAAPIPGSVKNHVGASNTSAAAGAAGSAYNPDGSVKPGREGEVPPPQQSFGGNTKTIYNTVPQITPKTSPTVQPGTANPNMEGLDLTQRGAEEQFYEDNQDFYTSPTNSQEFYDTDPFGGPGAGSQWNEQFGGEFANPMAGETYWQSVAPTLTGNTGTTNWVEGNQSALRGPGEGEQYVGDTLTKYKGGTPGTTNRAEEAFQQFQGSRPDVPWEAGLEPYYDNARKRGTEDLNRQLAARGVFGSGRGVDKLSDMYTNLGAEQANREADYRLRALGEERNWDTLMGNLAGSADMSSRLGSQNELAWTQGLGNMALASQGLGLERFRTGANANAQADASQIQQALAAGQISAEAAREELARLGMGGDFAFRSGQEDLQRGVASLNAAGQADTTTLGRMIAGQGAAAGAQGAQRTRAQDHFLNNLTIGDRFSGIIGAGMDGLFESDQENFDNSINMQTGIAATDKSDAEREKVRSDAKSDAWNQGLLTGGLAFAPSTYGLSMAPWLYNQF